MDDIYNDLENFNEVNIVEELKNKNKELKFKLEEYSGAMHQLQKDFDKLSGEYKKLEKNYSSLLKTARAEIERKTETIKKLNLEKDTLVLNSLQKGKDILHNRRNNFKDAYNKNPPEDTNSGLKEAKTLVKDSTDRLDKPIFVNREPSIETVSSIPTDCRSARSENKLSMSGFDVQIHKDGCSRDRDNRDRAHTKDKDGQERPSPRNIMSRRKSVPNFGDCEPRFSSDEDSRKSKIEPQQSDPSLAGEDVRHFDRHYETQDYVAPESFDYYQQAPPPSYRNRGNRYNDVERHRNYECYDKRKPYYSPDNHQNRYVKEFSENYNQRDCREKRRVEKSPPSDRYNRSKSRDRRHNFERENYRDYGRHPYHNNGNLPTKSKSKFELEEPSSKRPKVDSYSRHPSDNHFNREKERGTFERHPFTKEHLEPLSRQLPDYINDSNERHHSVKEIRPTSAIQLPDHRVLSNKYILKPNHEKSFPGTVGGCNVDVKSNSQQTWVEDKRKVLDKPFPKDVNFRPEMDVDVDIFGKSPSLESGEIQSLDENQYATNELNTIDHIKDHVKSSDDKSHQTISHSSATKEAEKSLITKYKIPHLKKNVSKESNNTLQQQDMPKKELHGTVKDFKVVVEGKHLSEKCVDNNSRNSKGSNNANANPIDNQKPDSILQKLVNESSENAKKHRKSAKTVNISTIEGDLELSDETSDNMDSLKEVTSPKTHNEKIGHLTKIEKRSSSEKLKDRADKSDDNIKKSRDSKKSLQSKKENVKEKTGSSPKKRRNKKEIEQEKVNVSKEILTQTKRSKEKSNKLISSHQKKNKFTDLFGDSDSLITPDDLGLCDVIPDKYVSVDENTQDAVDLSVEDITMVKARKSADTTGTVANSENLNTYSNENYQNSDSATVLYENAISETNTSNIVKTVIISTGVQPQHILKDTDDDSRPTNINKETDLQKTEVNTIEAIATSTPYKIINLKESQIPINSTMISNESVHTNDNMDKTDLPTNTSENKYESDIPDVRIFVRRRKKPTKKPT